MRLFGIRTDLAASAANLLRQPGRVLLKAIDGKVNVKQALAGMPALRSRLSEEPDSQEAWLSMVKSAPQDMKDWRLPIRADLATAMLRAWRKAANHDLFGGQGTEREIALGEAMPEDMRNWFHDPKLGGVLQHETRRHMHSDLHRYMFASCFAAMQKYSPKLTWEPQ